MAFNLDSLSKQVKEDVRGKSWPTCCIAMAGIAQVGVTTFKRCCEFEVKDPAADSVGAVVALELASTGACELQRELEAGVKHFPSDVQCVELQAVFGPVLAHVQSVLGDQGVKMIEDVKASFYNANVTLPAGVNTNAFLPNVKADGVLAWFRATTQCVPKSATALCFLLDRAGDGESLAHLHRGVGLRSKLRVEAARHEVALRRLDDEKAIAHVWQVVWEATPLSYLIAGCTTQSSANEWLSKDASELATNNEYNELVMALTDARAYWSKSLRWWHGRHSHYIELALKDLKASVPEEWIEVVGRWCEEEVRGEKFIKHPSRNSLAGLIDQCEGLKTQIDDFVKSLGVAADADAYMPNADTLVAKLLDAKLFMGSLHVAVTILKELPKADTAKAKASVKSKRECLQRLKAKVKV